MRIEYNKNLANNRKNILKKSFKISEEMLNDIPCIEHLKYSTKRVGFRLFLLSFEIGYDADDFIKNLFTCILTYKAYKKPRFIK